MPIINHRFSRYLDLLVLFGDLLCLNLGLYAAFWFQDWVGPAEKYWTVIIIANCLWVILSFLSKIHKVSRISKFSRIVIEISKNIFAHLLIIVTVIYFLKYDIWLRSYIFYSYLIFLISVFTWRAVYLYSIRVYRKYGYNYRNVAIIGYGELTEEIRKFLRLHPEYGFRFLGFFDNEPRTDELFIGRIKDLPSYIQVNRIDEIYCCLPYIKRSLIPFIIELGETNLIKIKLVEDFRGFEDKGFEIQRHDQLPVLEVTSFPLDEARNRVIKRAFDIVFSLVVLILISWLLPIIAIAIKLESKGPVFFIQSRSGKGNNNFWCLKFRTMYLNGNADLAQAAYKDERITKVGMFLRKTSLDELPQFFNVLIGNMSVVGPRPFMLYHTKIYSERLERFMARHFVKPGITGLAQCKGYRGEIKNYISLKNRLKLDRFYIENWSFYLDVKIIFATIVSIFKGDQQAY